MSSRSKPQSNPEDYLINPKELAEWLVRHPERQQAVTSHCYVSIHTIRSWWRGHTPIPHQYHKVLHQMMAGHIPIVLILNPDKYRGINDKAVEKGFSGAQDFLAELIEKIF